VLDLLEAKKREGAGVWRCEFDSETVLGQGVWGLVTVGGGISHDSLAALAADGVRALTVRPGLPSSKDS